MKVQQLVVALMIFSALVIGLTSFQGSLMINYEKNAQSENITSLERSQEINDKMKGIQQNIEDFEVLNPLTWGNLVGLAVDMFSVLFELPGMIHGITVDASTMAGLPGWLPLFAEGIILIVLVFGAFRAMRGGGV